jgi:thioredoxin reductase (NADPH)
MTFFSTSDRLEIGDVPFISHGIKPTGREALEYYRRVKAAWNLNVNLYEKVTSIEKQESAFSVNTEKDSYICSNLVIATGFFDFENRMNIPGEELPKVKHYYDEPHPYVEQRIAIVGGGKILLLMLRFKRSAGVRM